MGTNWIAIQAVDWAGNVAVTNFNYVFATNGDTTAPVVSVTWPSAGTLISGDSFTVQGTVDDDTATTGLQYLDTNGILQTVNGVVERGGKLWVENVPLVPGTNEFNLLTTDAAGNMSTNNLNVVQSDLSLTITPLSGEAMNYGYATVTGTVDDPAAVITVNGVEGVNSYGNWQVDNVPLAPGGTVALLVTAQLMGGEATQVLLAEDRQSVVFTQTYGYDLDWNFGAHAIQHNSMHWTRGGGGTNRLTMYLYDTANGILTSNLTVTIWPADSGYLPTLPGTETTSYYQDGILTACYTDTNIAAPEVEWLEQSQTKGSYSLVTYQEASGREVRLFTGGKATRQRHTLVDLSAGLKEEQYLDRNAADWGFFYAMGGFLWTGDPGVAVPSELISLGALGNQEEDGHLWTVQAEGKEIVITPTVAEGSAEGSSAAFAANVSQPANSAASAHNTTGLLPTESQCTLLSLTVVSNAVPVGGTNNWAAVKATNEWVYLKAHLTTDDTNAANQIVWSMGDAVAYDPFQRKISKATSDKYTVTATLGSTSTNLIVWIIWATVSIQTSGTTPSNAVPFAGMYDGTENLGGQVVGNDAVGKVIPIAQLTPAGVGALITNGWAFDREIRSHTFLDGDHGETWNTNWASDNSEAWVQNLTPDSEDKIYDRDAPNIDHFYSPNHPFSYSCVEINKNFHQWIEWNGVRASDGTPGTDSFPENAKWHWQAKRQSTDRSPVVLLKDASGGNITLPNTSSGCP